MDCSSDENNPHKMQMKRFNPTPVLVAEGGAFRPELVFFAFGRKIFLGNPLWLTFIVLEYI